MPFPQRCLTLLLALSAPAVVSGLSARGWAQTPLPPLLQVEGALQAEDDTLPDGSFYDIHAFSGHADQPVTILLESEAFDPYLILEDDQGNRIATNNDISTVNANAALITVLPATGQYRVVANAVLAEGQGAYRLTIYPTPAGQPHPGLSAVEVTLLQADQQFQAGIEHFQRSEFRAALARWEAALGRYRAAAVRAALPQDSRQGEANALGNLGSAYYAVGDSGQALDFFQQSLDIKRQIGDRRGEANALGNLGSAYAAVGDYGRALDFYQQSLDLARQIGDRQGEANALGNLGSAYHAVGDSGQALDFHLQALDLARQIGDRQAGMASTLDFWATTHRSLTGKQLWLLQTMHPRQSHVFISWKNKLSHQILEIL